MNCRVVPITAFKRDAKQLIKKYISLKAELAALGEQLRTNPRMGTHLGADTYKIRLSVKSKGKGKSGGLRVLTHVIEIELAVEESLPENQITVFLLAIYDKSEMENLSDARLRQLISEVNEELDEEAAN